MRRTESVQSPAPLIGLRRIASGARQRGPALSQALELVEHAAVHRMDHPDREMRRQRVGMQSAASIIVEPATLWRFFAMTD